jgi:putative membrane protein
MLHLKNGSIRVAHVAGLVWLTLAGCAATGSTTPAEAPSATITTSAAVPLREAAQPVSVESTRAPRIDASLTDGQIASIASDLHRAEINDATVALAQAQNPKVKAYAQEMVSVDANVEQHLDAVVQNQNIAPADSTLGTSLRSSDHALKDTLLAQSGADFDQSYITAQLKSHEDALRLFDETLIPDARNPALKTALQATRARLIQHILLAKQALAALPAN